MCFILGLYKGLFRIFSMDLFNHVFMFQRLKYLEGKLRSMTLISYLHYTWPQFVPDVTECKCLAPCVSWHMIGRVLFSKADSDLWKSAHDKAIERFSD